MFNSRVNAEKVLHELWKGIFLKSENIVSKKYQSKEYL